MNQEQIVKKALIDYVKSRNLHYGRASIVSKQELRKILSEVEQIDFQWATGEKF